LWSIAAIAASAGAPDLGQTGLGQTVKVCIEPGASAPSLLTVGQALSSKILATAGIRAEWRIERSGCAASNDDTIQVRFSDEPAKEPGDGVLASARPYATPGSGAQVEVYYQRIFRTVEPRLQPILLGHVLAHEIAHIIEGVNRHSESGIMKAHWDAGDYAEMSWRPLQFASADLNLIRLGLRLRASVVASGR
jgi:hypothetical protein